MSFRTYHQLPGPDASRLGEQVARQRARVAERLAAVARLTVVLSGKGGVGKSWITAALALALARRHLAVGVLDADLHSPTIARLLGEADDARLHVDEDGVRPVVTRAGVRVVSTDLLLDEGRALRWAADVGESHAWRGAAEASVLREFLADVAWGALHMLLVDMPPETCRVDDLAALLGWQPGVEARPAARAIAITIPSDESARSVARALDAAQRAGLPVLGIVENMSAVVCPDCGRVRRMFRGDAGARLAEQAGLPLLARIPFSHAPLDDAATLLAPVVEQLLRPAPVPHA